MFPVLFQGTAFELRSYTLMTLLGLAAGLLWIWRETGQRDHRPVRLAFEAFLVGIVATRVFFIAHNWDRLYAGKPLLEVLRPRPGMVWYAGPLVALPWTIWRIRRAGLEVLPTTDVFVQGLVLGHAVGRLGCLLHGCCHGAVWPREAWCTVTFTTTTGGVPSQLLGEPLFASQPFEALGCFAIFLVLAASRGRLARSPGALTCLYFALYAALRFVLEAFRGDEVRGFVARGVPGIGDLSTSQAISAAVLGPAVAGLAWALRRARSSTAT